MRGPLMTGTGAGAELPAKERGAVPFEILGLGAEGIGGDDEGIAMPARIRTALRRGLINNSWPSQIY